MNRRHTVPAAALSRETLTREASVKTTTIRTPTAMYEQSCPEIGTRKMNVLRFAPVQLKGNGEGRAPTKEGGCSREKPKRCTTREGRGTVTGI